MYDVKIMNEYKDIKTFPQKWYSEEKLRSRKGKGKRINGTS